MCSIGYKNTLKNIRYGQFWLGVVWKDMIVSINKTRLKICDFTILSCKITRLPTSKMGNRFSRVLEGFYSSRFESGPVLCINRDTYSARIERELKTSVAMCL